MMNFRVTATRMDSLARSSAVKVIWQAICAPKSTSTAKYTPDGGRSKRDQRRHPR